MKITAVDIYDVAFQSAWNPILIRVSTDEGIEGVGEVALAYGAGSDAALGMVKQLAERFLLGADPMRVEEMWKTLFFRTFWGQGGGTVVYGGISTIDQALWDIKGKAYNAPVYELLGGRVHDELRVYCNGWLGDEYAPASNEHIERPEQYAQRAAEVAAMGYDALKFDPFSAPRDSGWKPRERLLEPERGDLAFERVGCARGRGPRRGHPGGGAWLSGRE
jgi:galactonate dehydratase